MASECNQLRFFVFFKFISPPHSCFSGAYPAHEVNHVIIEERRRDDAGGVVLGMLTGAATGLAIGSLFSVF